jgi:hypothetical protein
MSDLKVNDFAPIVLFVYNRLDHTKETIDALKNNVLALDSNLIIYSDNYKDGTSIESVQEVRRYIQTVTGFKNIEIIERDHNFGLAKSIIDGVTSVVEKYGTIIVLEDDLVTSKYFLQYMNDALAYYQNNDDVISVHGYMFPVENNLPETFFLKAAHCWGWGTWKDLWRKFEPDSSKLISVLQEKGLDPIFDYNGAGGYWQMLQKQMDPKIDSWAIRWYASAFVANKLTLYPNCSLVNNIGLDSTGMHGKSTNVYKTSISNKRIVVDKIEIIHNSYSYNQIRNFFLKITPSFWSRIIKRLKYILINRV